MENISFLKAGPIGNDPLKIGAGGGSRTHTALRPTDFLTTAAFAALSGCRGHAVKVWGLDYPFTVPRTILLR